MSKPPHITVRPGQQAQQQSAAAAMTSPAEVIVKDGTGRTLTLAKPPFFAQFELARALGADSANIGYSTMVMPLLYLSAIGEDIVPTPSNHAQIKALVMRLGEEGYKALIEGINEHFGEKQVANEETVLKNS